MSLVLDLPKSYLCVMACVGEPNRYAMHGLHVDQCGLTCTDGKTLAHLKWMQEEVPRNVPVEGITVAVSAGVLVNGTRAKVDLTKRVESGLFPPYQSVMPDLSEKDYASWTPEVHHLDMLETFVRVGKAFCERDGAGYLRALENGITAEFRDPDTGEMAWSRNADSPPLVERLCFRPAVMGKALAAWKAGGNREPGIYWPRKNGIKPLVITGGRLTVLAMPAEAV